MIQYDQHIKALIRLKRQGAEQRLQRLGLARAALQAERTRLLDELAALDRSASDFGICHLSHEHGSIDRLLERIANIDRQNVSLEFDIKESRDTLKQSIFAESQVAGFLQRR